MFLPSHFDQHSISARFSNTIYPFICCNLSSKMGSTLLYHRPPAALACSNASTFSATRRRRCCGSTHLSCIHPNRSSSHRHALHVRHMRALWHLVARQGRLPPRLPLARPPRGGCLWGRLPLSHLHCSWLRWHRVRRYRHCWGGRCAAGAAADGGGLRCVAVCEECPQRATRQRQQGKEPPGVPTPARGMALLLQALCCVRLELLKRHLVGWWGVQLSL